MRKKYLSALLFGALLFASTATFTSCKDYDDDISNLQEQITANADAIEALQGVVDAGNYVTGVTGSGNQITFTFSKGEPTTITVDDGQEAQTITFSEEGEMLINGEGTGVYAHEPYVPEEPSTPEDPENPEAPEVGLVKAQEGTWWVLGEDGEYTNTNIPVSAVTAVGNDEDGYTLTIYGATASETQEIFIPGAASMITSIVLDNDQPTLTIIQATFNRPQQWAGPRTLPSNGSIIYSAKEGIKVRVNPVDAPATEVTYTLVNSRNQELSNIELTATADNSLLTIGNANGRAAGTSNGLYVLNMNDFTLASSAATSFNTDLNNKITSNGADVAFAINANVSTRSAYGVTVEPESAANLNEISIKQGSTVVENYNVGTTSNSVEVTVGQTYTIDEGTSDGAEGALYDMYFEFDEADIETYGIVYDNEARTFSVTNDPDISTTAEGFTMTVHTLDTKGNVETTTYDVDLSSIIASSDYTYQAVTYDIANLIDSNNNNNGFNIAISELRTELGDNWVSWINRVDLGHTTYALYNDANCQNEVVANDNFSSMTFTYANANGQTATSISQLSTINVTVHSGNDNGLSLDKQYYLKVTFNNSADNEVNSIIVPVTFTAPSVADQFTRDANFVVDDVITAYFYNTAAATKDQINVKRYFTAVDEYARLTLDTETTLATVGNTEYKSGATDTNDGLATLTHSGTTLDNDYIKLNEVGVNNSTGIELGYGKNLIVNANNTKFANTGWIYGEESDKNYQFTISIMSPIYEGTVTPVGNNSIPVIANNESGYAITGSMITGVDYNNNKFSVVPNTDEKGTPTNKKDNPYDAWTSKQIQNVYVTPDRAEYFNGGISFRIPGGTEKNPIEGAIVVKATPMPNTTETSITVHVTDVWGYTKAVSVPVTIQVGE